MLRGVLSWGWDPDLIAPNYGDDAIRAELRRVRELGFNLVKLCLVVHNRRYYEIADEEGVFLWQEWPMWLPLVTPELRQQAPAEYAALMRLTRQHPSVVLYSVGLRAERQCGCRAAGAARWYRARAGIRRAGVRQQRLR